MRIAFPKGGAGGFSLLEVLLALGLLALVASGILALFPVIEANDRDNAGETRAALIASGIMDALPSLGDETLLVAIGMSNGMPLWETIPRTGTNRSIAYDESCRPLFPLAGKSAELPGADQRVMAVVTLCIGKNSSSPGMLAAEVAVAEPASAPSERRTVRRFVRLIPEGGVVP